MGMSSPLKINVFREVVVTNWTSPGRIHVALGPPITYPYFYELWSENMNGFKILSKLGDFMTFAVNFTLAPKKWTRSHPNLIY